MGILEILLIGLGLAMDAFAVSICKGMSMKKFSVRNTIKIAIYFGTFQAIMPLVGYFLGATFQDLVTAIDHWIAFFLLGAIGLNMIKDSFDDEDQSKNDSVDAKTMLILSLATSIDALAIGVTFAFLNVNILSAISCIGTVTFCLSFIGVKVGKEFGDKLKNRAEIFGGIILIIIGLKILLEHLEIL